MSEANENVAWNFNNSRTMPQVSIPAAHSTRSSRNRATYPLPHKNVIKKFCLPRAARESAGITNGAPNAISSSQLQLPVPARVGSLLRLLLHRMCNFQGDTSRERRKLCLCFEILCSLLSQLRQANNNRNKHKLVCAGVCTTSKFPRKR